MTMTKNLFTHDVEHEKSPHAVSIAFVHHKGGTGKTTSCLNVAGWLARMDKKVLVIDLDPQGNATAGLRVDRKTLDTSIYDVLLGYRNIRDVILETDSGIYLAPSSMDLLAAETLMAGKMQNSHILKRQLGCIGDYFDYILIDVPPGSTLLMINGMVASENIIIPLDSGIFAFEAMETLKTLVIDLSQELGIEINILMALVRQCGSSILDKGPTREVIKMIKNFFDANKIPMVKICTIPFSLNVYRAQIKGIPISHYAPHSHVGRVFKSITQYIVHEPSLSAVSHA
jgi:chromosome partitioning protein